MSPIIHGARPVGILLHDAAAIEEVNDDKLTDWLVTGLKGYDPIEILVWAIVTLVFVKRYYKPIAI